MNTIATNKHNWVTILIIAALCVACAGVKKDDDPDEPDSGGEEPLVWHPAYPVDDFEQQDDVIMEGTGDWITYADTANGAQIDPSEDIASGVEPGGPPGSEYAMHITGNVGEGPSYGSGLEAFFELDGDEFVPRDFATKGNDGLLVWAKGNCKLSACVNMKSLVPIAAGGTCDETSSSECWMFHCTQTDEVLTDEWTLFEMPFTDFEQADGTTELDLSNIVSIQFVQASEICPEAEFDMWIDNVGIYGGEEWEEVWALQK